MLHASHHYQPADAIGMKQNYMATEDLRDYRHEREAATIYILLIILLRHDDDGC